MNDDRFNYKNFGRQPTWLIKQVVRGIQSNRNLDHFTSARNLQTLWNVNRASDSEPYDDLAPFMPHPMIWKAQESERKLNITQQCAIEFLSTFRKYDTDVEVVFTEWLFEIEMIAHGVLVGLTSPY